MKGILALPTLTEAKQTANEMTEAHARSQVENLSCQLSEPFVKRATFTCHPKLVLSSGLFIHSFFVSGFTGNTPRSLFHVLYISLSEKHLRSPPFAIFSLVLRLPRRTSTLTHASSTSRSHSDLHLAWLGISIIAMQQRRVRMHRPQEKSSMLLSTQQLRSSLAPRLLQPMIAKTLVKRLRRGEKGVTADALQARKTPLSLRHFASARRT
ncbi:hypothetical protein B0J14DRAFT_331104 [Halenospora varia]|nr:hypothetical protein B0J14DRAFT_331104 [Halenospora varia]